VGILNKPGPYPGRGWAKVWKMIANKVESAIFIAVAIILVVLFVFAVSKEQL